MKIYARRPLINGRNGYDHPQHRRTDSGYRAVRRLVCSAVDSFGIGDVMPIRPENRDRYPDDWKTISAAVREEAGQKCEWCGVENGRWIRRAVTIGGVAIWRYANASVYECGFGADTGEEVPYTEPDFQDYGPSVKVVLTVAHLDHTPENCARDNLKAICQRCHNRYDAPMRRRGIQARAKASCAVADMFGDSE